MQSKCKYMRQCCCVQYVCVCVVVNSTCDLDVCCSCSCVLVCTVHFGCICNQSMVNINKRRKLKRTETKKFDRNFGKLQQQQQQRHTEIESMLNLNTFVPISTQYIEWVSGFSFQRLSLSLFFRFIFNIILFNVLFTRDHGFWCIFPSSSFWFINIWVHFVWSGSGWFWRQWRRWWRWWWLRRRRRRWRQPKTNYSLALAALKICVDWFK